MNILLQILLLVVGFVCLVKGADMFVGGSSALARNFNVPGLIIGLTIVALGTSTPEMAVSTVAGNLLSENNFFIGNIDATIIAQAPKFRPYIDMMNENIARALNIDIDQVNVKATTEEGLGFTGSGEGISSQAICILKQPADLIEGMNYLMNNDEVNCQSCSGCKRDAN